MMMAYIYSFSFSLFSLPFFEFKKDFKTKKQRKKIFNKRQTQTQLLVSFAIAKKTEISPKTRFWDVGFFGDMASRTWGIVANSYGCSPFLPKKNIKRGGFNFKKK